MLCLLVTFVTFVCFLLLLKLKRPKSKNISSGVHFEYGWILNDQNNLIKKRNTCFKFSCKFNKPLYKKKCCKVFLAGINWSTVQNTISGATLRGTNILVT